MRVLSIDLDYIMYPTEHLYRDTGWDNNPVCRWDFFNKHSFYKETDLFYDSARLGYLKTIFEKSLPLCENVKFGYEHDDILYYVKDFDKIDLVNIDHHDDFLMGDYNFHTKDDDKNFYSKNLMLEYLHVKEYDRVNEGNWIGWLNAKNKLKSFTWIGNNNFIEKEKHDCILKLYKNHNFITDMNYDFGDFKFDHIFVCLSPQYIPSVHWNVINWFIFRYESLYKKTVNLRELETRKFEIDYRYRLVTDKITQNKRND